MYYINFSNKEQNNNKVHILNDSHIELDVISIFWIYIKRS